MNTNKQTTVLVQRPMGGTLVRTFERRIDALKWADKVHFYAEEPLEIIVESPRGKTLTHHHVISKRST